MSDRSKISWTDATWNPVRGCTKVSAGCKHCYAETFAERFRGVPGHPFEQGFDLRLVPEALELPLRWRKPRRIFVNSMSDLFHEDVPNEFIAAVFGVAAACPQHTLQIVTKRAARLPLWFAWLEETAERCAAVFSEDPLSWRRAHILRAAGLRAGVHHEASAGDMEARGWPLSNVHLLVSIEDQPSADKRIPPLLATPAAVRGVSAEPLLGPVDFEDVVVKEPSSEWHFDALRCDVDPEDDEQGFRGACLDWVIVGGESGPGARPCDVDWIRSLVEQCRAAQVPAFVKQLGACPVSSNPDDKRHCGDTMLPDGFRMLLRDRKGADPAEWPEDLRVQEFPRTERSA